MDQAGGDKSLGASIPYLDNGHQPKEDLEIGQGRKLMTPAELVKVEDILAACKDPADLDTLVELATTKGGFVNDEVRQVACTLSSGLLLDVVS